MILAGKIISMRSLEEAQQNMCSLQASQQNMNQQDFAMMQMRGMQNAYPERLRNLKPCRYCQQIDWGKHSCNRCGASKEKQCT